MNETKEEKTMEEHNVNDAQNCTYTKMPLFIGTKVIRAKPMMRGEYNRFRGWELPENERADDEGYLVEYTDGGEGNHPDFEGYISWSPKDVFDKAYRRTDNMSFGLAIEAMKQGETVCRKGWNGKGMYLFIATTKKFDTLGATLSDMFPDPTNLSDAVLPCVVMKTADNKLCFGWLASQTDMLADDWMIVG